MTNKWKLKYSCSEKPTSIRDIYIEVGKRNCNGEEDRGTFAVMNQLLSGHTLLKSHRANINSTVSELCESQLGNKVGDILNGAGLNEVAYIDLAVLISGHGGKWIDLRSGGIHQELQKTYKNLRKK